ncbi:hypothetical protein TZ53_21235 [Sphingobium sp. YBL2]|nr:hypothetical protein TZ53_21235 [Sphingobium sp. YBL2]
MMSLTDKTENWPGRRIAFKSFAADLARRRAELGITDADIPRNSGTRRTASKKALLKAIRDAGGNW